MRLTEICLITDDVPALAGFYAKITGAQAEGDHVHTTLHTEGAVIALFSMEGMEAMATGSMPGAGHGGFMIGLEVHDVDAEYKRLCSMGVAIVKHLATHPWGARSFWFRDPDGNIIAFYTVLHK